MNTETKEASWCVYIHTNMNDNKKYIGITSQIPEKRWKNGHGYTYNPYFYNAINKYGWDSFLHEIVCDDLSEEEAKTKEIDLIAKYNTTDDRFGYNLTKGGAGTTGRKCSEETKKKISNAHIGMTLSDDTKKKISESLLGNQRAKGMTHSAETRAKISQRMIGNTYGVGNVMSEEARKMISESLKGRKVSDETRRKLSEINKGHEVSEETRRKISIANKGRSHVGHKFSEESRKKMSESRKRYLAEHHDVAMELGKRYAKQVDMLNVDGEFIRSFDSAAAAKESTGIDNSSIIKVCKGKANTAGGYKWRYSDTHTN